MVYRVDVTDVDTTKPHALTFVSNPDQFLCEGNTLVINNPVDPADLSALVFDPTTPPVYDSNARLTYSSALSVPVEADQPRPDVHPWRPAALR